MRHTSRHFDALRAHLDDLPLIDIHDHAHALGPNYTDAARALFWGYAMDDLASAGGEAERDFVLDPARSLEERWPRLEALWQRCKFSGYGELTRRVLRRFYGRDELTLDALRHVQANLLDVNDAVVYEAILAEANIPVRIICGTIGWELNHTRAFLAGEWTPSPRGREVILLDRFLRVTNRAGIEAFAGLGDGLVESVEDYIERARTVFTACKARGAVGFKDIRAYHRPLASEERTRDEAAAVFERLMRGEDLTADYPQALAPLEDYLIDAAMRIAAELALPVQVHTGHLAGGRGDIRQANAADMIPLLARHRETQFNLFHANWPYDGEFLFIGKNYPNVLLDLSWTHIIDPVYCRRLLEQAVSCMPHGKLHLFGADFGGFNVDKAWGHAAMARDHLATALCDVIESGRIGLDDAHQIAEDWMFHNANRFFGLGLRFEDHLRGAAAAATGKAPGEGSAR